MDLRIIEMWTFLYRFSRTEEEQEAEKCSIRGSITIYSLHKIFLGSNQGGCAS
jgi:hypothetical protein